METPCFQYILEHKILILCTSKTIYFLSKNSRFHAKNNARAAWQTKTERKWTLQKRGKWSLLNNIEFFGRLTFGETWYNEESLLNQRFQPSGKIPQYFRDIMLNVFWGNFHFWECYLGNAWKMLFRGIPIFGECYLGNAWKTLFWEMFLGK